MRKAPRDLWKIIDDKLLSEPFMRGVSILGPSSVGKVIVAKNLGIH